VRVTGLGRGKIREAKYEEVDPEVELMFDKLWEAFLDVVEDVVDYDARASGLWDEMSQELGDAVAEELMYDAVGTDFCDTLAAEYFAEYIVTGRSSIKKLKDDINEDIGLCFTEEELDELVKCVNTYYRCYKLLVKFLRSLPSLLTVKIVEGNPTQT
jgi:hypothetical protein